MIVLTRKEDCCGCHACETACPKKCISMHEDSEGFLYPETDTALCIDCGLCEKVCPIIATRVRKLNRSKISEPIVYAACCSDENLHKASASGGAFTVIAERVIRNGGVVFGARWNSDFTEVVHDFTETLDGLAAFRGSKYLQSRIGDTFRKAREFLRAGREVMFTGTPCQIAGLRRALRADFSHLLSVDIGCYCVPSPRVWRVFLEEMKTRKHLGEIEEIAFRKKVFNSKRGKWDCANFFIKGSHGSHCSSVYTMPYGVGFINGLYTRPSCDECPSKNRMSGSDLTIGDFWGVEKFYPHLDAQAGLSVVICNTQKGADIFEQIKPNFSILQKVLYEEAIIANTGLKRDMVVRNPKRNSFFKDFNSTTNTRKAAKIIRRYTEPELRSRIRSFLRRAICTMLSRAGLLSFVKGIFKK